MRYHRNPKSNTAHLATHTGRAIGDYAAHVTEGIAHAMLTHQRREYRGRTMSLLDDLVVEYDAALDLSAQADWMARLDLWWVRHYKPQY